MELRKELLVCRKKIDLLSELLQKEQDKINLLVDKCEVLDRSHKRNLADWKQFSKDLGYPVTGNVTPDESSELLVISLCNRDRGC